MGFVSIPGQTGWQPGHQLGWDGTVWHSPCAKPGCQGLSSPPSRAILHRPQPGQPPGRSAGLLQLHSWGGDLHSPRPQPGTGGLSWGSFSPSRWVATRAWWGWSGTGWPVPCCCDQSLAAVASPSLWWPVPCSGGQSLAAVASPSLLWPVPCCDTHCPGRELLEHHGMRILVMM